MNLRNLPRLALAVAALGLLVPAGARSQPSVTGRWTPFSTPLGVESIHMALLKGSGGFHSKILTWGYTPAAAPGRMILWGWNPTGGEAEMDCASFPVMQLPQQPIGFSGGPDLYCSGHSALADGRLLISGGHDEANSVGLRQSILFDPQAPVGSQWIPQPAMENERWYPTQTTLRDGRVLSTAGTRFLHAIVLGGADAGSSTHGEIRPLGLTTTGRWLPQVPPGSPWPDPVEGHTAVWSPGWSRLVQFGGRIGAGGPTNRAWHLFMSIADDQMRYTWAEITNPAPPARSRHTAVMRPLNGNDHRMVVFGGLDAGGQALQDVRELSRPGGAWAWSAPSVTGSAGARYGHTAVYDAPRDRMLVFGGLTAPGALADNQVHSLSLATMTWSQVTLATKPGAREGHSFVLDPTPRSGPFSSADQRVILFGGNTGTHQNDVWVLWISGLNGDLQWQQVGTLNGAPAGGLSRHAAMWDQTQPGTTIDRMIVIGGENAGGKVAGAWALDRNLNGWTSLTALDVGLSGLTATYQGAGIIASKSELFTPPSGPGTGTWQLIDAPKWQPNYPFLFLLPSGHVFCAGPDVSSIIDPLGPSHEWQHLPEFQQSTIDGASAVMYEPGKIMKCGSQVNPTHGVTAKIEFDAADNTSGWTTLPGAMTPRSYHNLTVLPNGKVLMTGGFQNAGNVGSMSNPGVKNPEIWDPATGQWSGYGVLAPDPARRGYHSTIILMPDGRLLSAGGEPGVPFLNPDFEMATMFCPPYLFNPDGTLAPRPVITSSYSGIGYNGPFYIATPDDPISSVCLIKASSVTHAFNMDQRYIPLSFTPDYDHDRLVVMSPPNANHAPPGDYMLFVNKVNPLTGHEVPSIGWWVRIQDGVWVDAGPSAPGDLVGWWPFDEGSGTAILDASGRANNGTLPGGATWTAGVHDLALHLNGSNQRALVPDRPTLDITGAITLATWVKPQQTALQNLIHKGNTGGQDGYELSLDAGVPGSGTPFVRFNDLTNGNEYRLSATQPYPADGNTWLHLAATYDGDTLKLYVNGVLDSSKAASFAIGANSQPVGIGGQSDGQSLLQGALDDARIYGRALTTTEIEALAYPAVIATAGSGGTIAPSGTVTVTPGGDATFTIAPDTCHTIADVKVDGISVGAVALHTITNVTSNHTITATFSRKTYTVTATAGAGGAIAPSGAVPVNCAADQSFSITPDPGYVVADVKVDGVSVGAVLSHVLPDVHAPHTIAVSFSADHIEPVPIGGTIITIPQPCVAVPIVFTRANATPIRGYSVTLELSSNLTLCGAQAISAEYLQAPRHLEITPLSGNRWTIDEVTLGQPCGVTGSAPIFHVIVTSNAATGTGTIQVVSALARNCNNLPVPVVPGPPAAVPIDREGPARNTDLVAVPVRTGNPPPQPPLNAVTSIRLQFSIPAEAVSVQIYRKGFGGYPQYDENGGVAPALPASLPAAGWVLTAVTAPAQTDKPPARDFWYYALVTKDIHGNPSQVSNLTAGTLNYHLGDFHDGATPCTGDNLVNTPDMSMLGAYYGASLPVNDPLECMDVGPTTNGNVGGRPVTDNLLDFEDFMILSNNYDVVSAPQGPARAERTTAETAADQLSLGGPERVTAGETFEVPLLLKTQGWLIGLSVKLGWNEAVARPVSVRSGGLFEAQGGVFLVAGAAGADAALLGPRAAGFTGEGTYAIVTFLALANGAPELRVAGLKARDAGNREIPVELGRTASALRVPLATRFGPPMPSPFSSSTTLEYALAARGAAELTVFSADGRRVRTLARGEQEPGVYRLTWDGADERGHRSKAGVYFARLTTDAGRFTRTLVLRK